MDKLGWFETISFIKDIKIGVAMGRRDMEVGDAVAVNDNGCKGIGFVVASSDDPEKTGGV